MKNLVRYEGQSWEFLGSCAHSVVGLSGIQFEVIYDTAWLEELERNIESVDSGFETHMPRHNDPQATALWSFFEN